MQEPFPFIGQSERFLLHENLFKLDYRRKIESRTTAFYFSIGVGYLESLLRIKTLGDLSENGFKNLERMKQHVDNQTQIYNPNLKYSTDIFYQFISTIKTLNRKEAIDIINDYITNNKYNFANAIDTTFRCIISSLFADSPTDQKCIIQGNDVCYSTKYDYISKFVNCMQVCILVTLGQQCQNFFQPSEDSSPIFYLQVENDKKYNILYHNDAYILDNNPNSPYENVNRLPFIYNKSLLEEKNENIPRRSIHIQSEEIKTTEDQRLARGRSPHKFGNEQFLKGGKSPINRSKKDYATRLEKRKLYIRRLHILIQEMAKYILETPMPIRSNDDFLEVFTETLRIHKNLITCNVAKLSHKIKASKDPECNHRPKRQVVCDCQNSHCIACLTEVIQTAKNTRSQILCFCKYKISDEKVNHIENERYNQRNSSQISPITYTNPVIHSQPIPSLIPNPSFVPAPKFSMPSLNPPAFAPTNRPQPQIDNFKSVNDRSKVPNILNDKTVKLFQSYTCGYCSQAKQQEYYSELNLTCVRRNNCKPMCNLCLTGYFNSNYKYCLTCQRVYSDIENEEIQILMMSLNNS